MLRSSASRPPKAQWALCPGVSKKGRVPVISTRRLGCSFAVEAPRLVGHLSVQALAGSANPLHAPYRARRRRRRPGGVSYPASLSNSAHAAAPLPAVSHPAGALESAPLYPGLKVVAFSTFKTCSAIPTVACASARCSCLKIFSWLGCPLCAG